VEPSKWEVGSRGSILEAASGICIVAMDLSPEVGPAS
jgi:hypothetical protein